MLLSQVLLGQIDQRLQLILESEILLILRVLGQRELDLRELILFAHGERMASASAGLLRCIGVQLRAHLIGLDIRSVHSGRKK